MCGIRAGGELHGSMAQVLLRKILQQLMQGKLLNTEHSLHESTNRRPEK